MSVPPIDAMFRPEDDDAAYAELRALAVQLKDAIAAQPIRALLGYLYGHLLMGNLRRDDDAPPHVQATSRDHRERLNQLQFVLEYVHATWAGSDPHPAEQLDEAGVAQIMELAEQLRQKSLWAAMRWARRNAQHYFGDADNEFAIKALSDWILLRGNRYQSMEAEFYRFVLMPHDGALLTRFGVGAEAIAQGMQALADAIRMGQARAAERFHGAYLETLATAEREGISLGEATERLGDAEPARKNQLQDALADLVMGGTCNAGRHCNLPPVLLNLLAYAPGEETTFWAEGTFAGTPFRALPARKRPLLRLGEEFYQTDPSFIRDASYPALLYQLQQGGSAESTAFRKRQQTMAEDAFPAIFATQLAGARIYRSVFYRIPGTNWRENDIVIVLDDTLILVEAKAGAAATLASPASDMARHIRAVQDLIVKAYQQCKGLLERMQELDEVPLCELRDGRYHEVTRLRLSEFRRVIPIGLTVESLAPFSSSAARLPEIEPILGRFPFISVAIDELLVVRRLLRSASQLMHYLAMRQVAAGKPQLLLFDETDHLGAYLQHSRYPDVLTQNAGQADLVVGDGMSDIVDSHFMDPDEPADVERHAVAEVEALLSDLERAQPAGWLAVNELLRDVPAQPATQVGMFLRVSQHAVRHRPQALGWIATSPPLVFAFQRGAEDELAAAAGQLAADVAAVTQAAQAWLVTVIGTDAADPRGITLQRIEAGQAASEAAKRDVSATAWPLRGMHTEREPAVKPGRNAPCPCGSGKKYKRCHGA